MPNVDEVTRRILAQQAESGASAAVAPPSLPTHLRGILPGAPPVLPPAPSPCPTPYGSTPFKYGRVVFRSKDGG